MLHNSSRPQIRDAASLLKAAVEFQHELDALKAQLRPNFAWYPYGTLNNFVHLSPLLEAHPLPQLAESQCVADIGAADGDIAFFLEELGYSVDVIDYAPTNYNSLRGVRLLREHLGSSINIYEADLDNQFALPRERFGLIFLLGILYHLKNPFYVLETLAHRSRHLLISTRIARYTSTEQPIHDIPAAYLLAPGECNDDATNFWIFTPVGLGRILERSGWEVLASRTVGDTVASDPARPNHDERFFGILRSRLLI